MTITAEQQLLEEIQAFQQRYPDIQHVDLIAMDIPGNFFGKRYPLSVLEKFAKEGVKIPASMPLMSTRGEPISVRGFGWEDGDPDIMMDLVPGSLQRVSWESQPGAQILITGGRNGDDLIWEPRQILARVLGILEQDGLFPVVAFEPEFYLVNHRRTNDGCIQPPTNPVTGDRDGCAMLGMERISGFGDCLGEISCCCAEQGIETGAVSAELGPGQFEINLNHQSNALTAADQFACYRRVVKGVAHKHGLQATFMAKPYLEEAGNGLHVHISLPDKNGQNLFSQKERLLNAVAGCLNLMPQSMAIFAANRNAYRRLVPIIAWRSAVAGAMKTAQ